MKYLPTEFKIRVFNPDLNEAIQKRLFMLGCKWTIYGQKYSVRQSEFLFVDSFKTITWSPLLSFFEKQEFPEITIEQLMLLDFEPVKKQVKLRDAIAYVEDGNNIRSCVPIEVWEQVKNSPVEIEVKNDR